MALAGEKAECKEREIPTFAPVLGDTGTRPVLKPSPREYLSPCWCPLEPVGECRGRHRAARSRMSSLLCPTATQTYPSLFRCSWLGHLTQARPAAIPSSSRSKVVKLVCQLYYYRGTPQRYRNWCAHRHRHGRPMPSAGDVWRPQECGHSRDMWQGGPAQSSAQAQSMPTSNSNSLHKHFCHK